MNLGFLGAVVLVVFGTSVVLAGRWGEWHSISLCDAEPCNCTGEVKNAEKCLKGKRTELRRCIVGKDGRACQYENDGDGLGAIRIVECKNVNDLCPGWTGWMPIGKCESKTNGKKEQNGTIECETAAVKRCTNPPPIHPNVLCMEDGSNNPSLEMTTIIACNCTEGEEDTTDAPEQETTKLHKPCCPQEVTTPGFDFNDTSDDYFDRSGNSSNSSNDFDDVVSEESDEEEVKEDPSWAIYYDETQDSTESNQDCVPCPIVHENVTKVNNNEGTTTDGI